LTVRLAVSQIGKKYKGTLENSFLFYFSLLRGGAAVE